MSKRIYNSWKKEDMDEALSKLSQGVIGFNEKKNMCVMSALIEYETCIHITYKIRYNYYCCLIVFLGTT